jgi:hypothetical protein
MSARSPLWPKRRPLWGTILVIGVAGIFIGIAFLAIPGAHQSGLYGYMTKDVPLDAYAAGWLTGGLLTVAALLAGHRSLRWVLLGYACGQMGWAFIVFSYAVQDGQGLGLVGAGTWSALAVVTWLSAPAVASVP